MQIIRELSEIKSTCVCGTLPFIVVNGTIGIEIHIPLDDLLVDFIVNSELGHPYLVYDGCQLNVLVPNVGVVARISGIGKSGIVP